MRAELSREDFLSQESILPWRSIADNSPDPLLLIGGDGRIRYASRGLAGQSVETLSGASFFALFSPDDTARLQHAFDALSPGEIAALTVRSEEVHWYRLRLRGMADRSGTVVIAYDITDQKEIEDAAQHLASLVEFSNDAIIGVSVEGRIVSWNGGAERLYGYCLEEAIGKNLFSLLDGESASSAADALRRVARGAQIREHDAMHRRKNGEPVEVSLALSPTRDLGGVVIGISAIASDMTARRSLERRLLEVGDWQQKKIGRDLHDDLGQPLTGIAFLCDVLSHKLADRGLPEAQDAARIAALINKATAKVREISRGLNPPHLLSVGLVAALEELSRDVADMFQISCRVDADSAISVEPDVAEHLYRIAQEALTNAIKHGHAHAASIRLLRDGDRLILSVANDGVGMDPQPSASRGLGLQIMKNRAQMIGASLILRSEPEGTGTLVECVLPLSERAGDTAPL